MGDPVRVGDRVTVDIASVAHGGHCVARADGQVVFVRHTLPGERVVAQVTEVGPGNRFLRADAVEVLRASIDRVDPPCRYAGECGGCDWQHVALPAQRSMKSDVLREALGRVVPATVLDDLQVESVPGDRDGLRWRTRMRFHVGPDGHPGLLRHRSHEVVPVTDCLIGSDFTAVLSRTWGAAEILCVRAEPTVVVPDPQPGQARVIESAVGRTWRVDAAGFWQVHPGAANTLVACVRGFAGVRPGERCLDLYSGVGLFAGALAADVTESGALIAVEADAQACRDARRNLHDLPWVQIVHADVPRWLRGPGRSAMEGINLAIADPPRTGLGRAVVRELTASDIGRVVYVSCEPTTLARDLGYLAEEGFKARAIRAFDCFPMTHHMETVILLERAT